MEWTTEIPTKPGWYWVIDIQWDPDRSIIRMAEFMVRLPDDEPVGMYLPDMNAIQYFSGFSHYMGPIAKPSLPIP